MLRRVGLCRKRKLRGEVHMRSISKIIAVVWAIIFSGALVLTLFPKLALLIPRSVLEIVRVVLIVFLLASLIHAIAWLVLTGVRFIKAK
jgi:hypothetical protein